MVVPVAVQDSVFTLGPGWVGAPPLLNLTLPSPCRFSETYPFLPPPHLPGSKSLQGRDSVLLLNPQDLPPVPGRYLLLSERS